MLPARGGGGHSGNPPSALHPLLAAGCPVLFLFAPVMPEEAGE